MLAKMHQFKLKRFSVVESTAVEQAVEMTVKMIPQADEFDIAL